MQITLNKPLQRNLPPTEDYSISRDRCGIKHAFMPITVNVVTEEEYNQWLEKAKVEFAKEEIENNIKVAKKIKEIK